MYIVYDDSIVNYEEYVSSKNKFNLIVLHGWKQSTLQFRFLKDRIKNTNLFLIDLPNFGESSKLKKSVDLNYYVKFLNNFIAQKKLKNIVVLGHSFGGRILIKLLSESPNENIIKLVLVDSAGIRPKRGFVYYWKIYTYKIFKKINKNLKKGSTDYQNADNYLKGTLSKVVNEDLKENLKNIRVPTKIFWGSDDSITPIKDAYLMNELIEKSQLIIFPNAGHFSYENYQEYFISNLSVFIYE